MNLTKGMRITARWFAVQDPVKEPFSLAGVQMKLLAKEIVVSGIVRHVRGDHPTNPTQVRLYIDAPGGTETPPGCTCGPHVGVNPDHVIEVGS